MVQRFSVNGTMVRLMVDEALLKLTSARDLGTAWTRLGITPQDVVGIKITTMGGPLLSTHRSIVQAICDGLQAAGVPPSQIIIWDKDAFDMRSAGYAPAPPPIRTSASPPFSPAPVTIRLPSTKMRFSAR